MIDKAIPSKFAELPTITGRILMIFPSEDHVRAVQKLLGDKISQEPAIGWQELHDAPERFPDRSRLVFLNSEGIKRILALNPKTTFFAEEVFVLSAEKLITLRDITGRRWGNDGGLSQDVLDGFQDIYKELNREGL